MKWKYTLLIILGILIIAGIGIYLYKPEIIKQNIINSIHSSIINYNSIPVSSGYYDGEFTYELTGNESKWVDNVKFNGREVIIIPKEKVEDRTYKECVDYDVEKEICLKEQDKVYSIPEIMPVKVSDEKITDISKIKIEEKDTGKLIDSFTYKIPLDVHYLKIGESSITITELQVTTQSNLVNVTAETGQSNFTHLTINSANAPYDSLVGYWNFDADAVNTVSFKSYDWSKNNNDGTAGVTSTVDSTGCVYGNCLQPQNVSNSGILLPADPFNITGNLSISAWFSPYTQSGRNVIFSRGTVQTVNAYALVLDYINGYLQFIVSNGSITSGSVKTAQIADSNFSLNVWHHAVGTWNGTIVTLYVDGGALIKQSTPATFSKLNPANLATYIGRQGSSNIRGFNGTLDEIMVFNTSLTAEQISAIYNNQSARFAVIGTQDIVNQSYMGNWSINCFQESATSTTDCGGLDTGVYATSGSWSNSANTYDSDWSTYGSSNDGYFYINYTKPTTALNRSMWQVKDLGGISNYTIPVSCFDYYAELVSFRVEANDAPYVNWTCYNGGWFQLRYDDSANRVYEEAIIWKVGSNRINVTTYTESLLGSSINLSVGYFNGTWYSTLPQTITSGVVHIFNISNKATNLTFNYTFNAGNSTNPFYSPIIKNNITFDSWNEAEAGGDTIYPIFSDYEDDSLSLTTSGTGYFNVTVKNTNGTVILNIDGNSIYATNVTIDKYNASYDFLSAGNYPYTWTAYGNGTSHNLNTSASRDYIVNSIEGLTSCETLDIANTIYILENNVSAETTCFIIDANNITLDCGGYEINYSYSGSGYGVDSSNHDYTTIKNCKIQEGDSSGSYEYPIYFYNTKNGTIFNNTIITTSESSSCIYLASNSDYNIINNNTGIIIGDDGYGIYLFSSSYNVLTNNTMNATKSTSYIIYGTTASHFNHTIGGDNLAKGLPINYTYNEENKIYDAVDFTIYGEVMFGYGRNITIKNSNFSTESLILTGTNTSFVLNNNITTNEGYGIYLFSYSDYNNISNNDILTTGVQYYGIHLGTYSDYNNLSNNRIITTNDYAKGIRIEETSNNNNVLNNVIHTSGTGSYGIYMSASSYNSFINNSIFSAEHGIYSTLTSDYNNFANDSIQVSGTSNYGIDLSSSPHNTFNSESIITSGTTGYGVYLSSSNNLSFTKMHVITNGTNANSFYIYNSNQNFTLTDSILNSSLGAELYIRSAVNRGIWDFTNVTRADGNNLNISWTPYANGTLNVMWYLDVNVTDGTSPLENANVTTWDVSYILQNSSLTGSNGLTRHILLEYKNINDTLKTYYSNYTVNTTLINYNNDTQSVNMSTNRWLNVVLTTTVSNCWLRTGNILKIPRGCVYQVNRGSLRL